MEAHYLHFMQKIDTEHKQQQPGHRWSNDKVSASCLTGSKVGDGLERKGKKIERKDLSVLFFFYIHIKMNCVGLVALCVNKDLRYADQLLLPSQM